MTNPAKGAAASVAPVLKLAPVTSIRQSAPSLSDNCRACIDSLEYLLGLARLGKLHGLMYVGIVHESNNDYDFALDIKGKAAGDHAISMMGVLPILQQDLIKLVRDL